MTSDTPRKEAEDLRRAADASPDDADLSLRAALALDKVSRESTAIHFYERALKLGLGKDDALLATVCLISSLRNVHRYDDALGAIREGLRRFPNSVVLSVFSGLIKLDSGEPNTAFCELGTLVLNLGAHDLGEVYSAIIKSKLRGVRMRKGLGSRACGNC